MGNSSYMKHIEAAGTPAFHLTKLEDETTGTVDQVHSRLLNMAQSPSYTPMQSKPNVS